MSEAAEWLNDQRDELMTSDIEYWRKDELLFTVLATRGKAQSETMEVDDFAIGYNATNFLISVALMIKDDVQIFPERGDKLKEVVGARGIIYEALPPGEEQRSQTDEDIWRYTDSFRNTFRIHVKRIKDGLIV